MYLSLKNQSQPSSVGSHRSDSRDSGYDKDSESDFYEKIQLLNGCSGLNNAEMSRIEEYCNGEVAFKDRAYHDSGVGYSYNNESDKINDYLSQTSGLYSDKEPPIKIYEKSYYSRKIGNDNSYYEKTFNQNSGKNFMYNNVNSNNNGSTIPQNNLPFNHMQLLYNQPPLARPPMNPHQQPSHHQPHHQPLHQPHHQPHHQPFNHPPFHHQPTQNQASHYQPTQNQSSHYHQSLPLQSHPHQASQHHNLLHFTDPHISNGLSFESLASHYEQHSKSIQQSNTNNNH